MQSGDNQEDDSQEHDRQEDSTAPPDDLRITEEDLHVLAYAFHCILDTPDIDYENVSRLTGLRSAIIAKRSVTRIRNKIRWSTRKLEQISIKDSNATAALWTGDARPTNSKNDTMAAGDKNNTAAGDNGQVGGNANGTAQPRTIIDLTTSDDDVDGVATATTPASTPDSSVPNSPAYMFAPLATPITYDLPHRPAIASTLSHERTPPIHLRNGEERATDNATSSAARALAPGQVDGANEALDQASTPTATTGIKRAASKDNGNGAAGSGSTSPKRHCGDLGLPIGPAAPAGPVAPVSPAAPVVNTATHSAGLSAFSGFGALGAAATSGPAVINGSTSAGRRAGSPRSRLPHSAHFPSPLRMSVLASDQSRTLSPPTTPTRRRDPSNGSPGNGGSPSQRDPLARVKSADAGEDALEEIVRAYGLAHPRLAPYYGTLHGNVERIRAEQAKVQAQAQAVLAQAQAGESASAPVRHVSALELHAAGYVSPHAPRAHSAPPAMTSNASVQTEAQAQAEASDSSCDSTCDSGSHSDGNETESDDDAVDRTGE